MQQNQMPHYYMLIEHNLKSIPHWSLLICVRSSRNRLEEEDEKDEGRQQHFRSMIISIHSTQ